MLGDIITRSYFTPTDMFYLLFIEPQILDDFDSLIHYLTKDEPMMLETLKGGVVFVFYVYDCEEWNKSMKHFFKKVKKGRNDNPGDDPVKISLLEDIVETEPDSLKVNVESLLKRAYTILEEMQDIVKTHNCAVIASSKDTKEQTFNYKGQCYILSDPLVIEKLQHRLTDISNVNTYEKIISNNQTKPLNGLLDIIV